MKNFPTIALIFTSLIFTGSSIVSQSVSAQDIDYDNLSLGIYGTAGENSPVLTFATREGGTPRFTFLKANPKGFYMQAGSMFPSFTMWQEAAVNSLGLGEFGVGIGTVLPTEALHVYSSDRTDIGFSEARVLVENDKSDTALRTMFELINNGPSRFELNNTNSGETWAFQTNASDNFMINRLGSGGNEFSIRKNGMVTMGPGSQTNFLLQPNGNLDIAGTLNQLSDRNAKEGFQDVDTAEVLKKISRLPVTTWKYKDDENTVRHMGPMAQDFRAAFGLGQNDTSIATVDTSGVALAAIQALVQQLDEQKDLVCEQETRIQQLEIQVVQLVSAMQK